MQRLEVHKAGLKGKLTLCVGAKVVLKWGMIFLKFNEVRAKGIKTNKIYNISKY